MCVVQSYEYPYIVYYIYKYFRPSFRMSFRLSFRPSVRPSLPSVRLPSVRQSFPSVRLSFRPSVLTVCPSPFRPSFRPSVRPSFRLLTSVSLVSCLRFFLSVSAFKSRLLKVLMNSFLLVGHHRYSLLSLTFCKCRRRDLGRNLFC